MTQEAFKAWWYNEGSQAPYTHHDCEEHTMRMCEIAWNKAQALAQPEQEPVAWMSSGEARMIHWKSKHPGFGDDWIPLYTKEQL